MQRGPWQDEADLVVVGASLGGLAAAVTAADRGCRVLLVERTKELGGRAGGEAELLAAAGTRWQQAAGMSDGPERLADDILAATRHHVEPALATALARQSAATATWLADRCGAPIELLAGHDGGHSAARLHLAGERGGARLVADLARAVTHHSHVTIRQQAVGERLVRDDAGAVRGVALKPERRGGTPSLGGRVLLACGGFAGNEALVAAHCAALAALPPAAASLAAGDALRLGSEAGAALRRRARAR
jgi:fumarate reductase flavoprotein subunit